MPFVYLRLGTSMKSLIYGNFASNKSEELAYLGMVIIGIKNENELGFILSIIVYLTILFILY